MGWKWATLVKMSSMSKVSWEVMCLKTGLAELLTFLVIFSVANPVMETRTVFGFVGFFSPDTLECCILECVSMCGS